MGDHTLANLADCTARAVATKCRPTLVTGQVRNLNNAESFDRAYKSGTFSPDTLANDFRDHLQGRRFRWLPLRGDMNHQAIGYCDGVAAVRLNSEQHAEHGLAVRVTIYFEVFDADRPTLEFPAWSPDRLPVRRRRDAVDAASEPGKPARKQRQRPAGSGENGGA